MEIILASVMGVAVLGGALAARPLRRWYRKVKRRKGGVYLWRVRHHRNPMRRVNGYVGETVSYYFRSKQHMGTSFYATPGGKRTATAVKVPAQPWSDLDPVLHKVIPLPWWLCWKWVLRPLETLVMLCTWPVYNVAKNGWNPRRIGKHQAAIQRRERDNLSVHGMAYRAQVGIARAGRIAVQVLGVLLILAGAYGWVVTR